MEIPAVNVSKILYATDLSENARHAFAFALSQANLYGASITLLHVLVEDVNLDKKVIGYIGTDQWEEIKDRHIQDARNSLIGKKRSNSAIQEALGCFSSEASQSLACNGDITDEVVVIRGNPADEIIKQASDRHCDLIVMGSHGHGALTEAMLGNTARRVLRRTNVPVLVVNLPQ
jgi:nucleotide-binding universal stress UspA family protein